jgi:hypothetical protein
MSNTKTRKLSPVRKPNEPLRLEPGEAVHVDVDVHKASPNSRLDEAAAEVLGTSVCRRRMPEHPA